MSANDLYLTTEQDLTTVAEAIRTRGGTSEALEYPDGFASAIAAIPGNVEVQEKDVNFYDYDGTLLYSYTKAQALALSALPENPSHEGLTAQGWNWTLAEIQAELTTYPDQFIQVGQMYTTTSGKTEIEIELTDSNFLSPYIFFAVNGTAIIEWGDNTTPTTLTGASLATVINSEPHTYSSAGKYTITIAISEGGTYCFKGNSTDASVLRQENRPNERIYTQSVKKIRFGTGARTGAYAFMGCINLETVTLNQDAMVYATNYALRSCVSLKHITIPRNENHTSLGTSIVENGHSIKNISLPKTITTLNNSNFAFCASIKRIGIPSSITSMAGSVFASCENLEKVYMPGITSLNYISIFEVCYKLKEIRFSSSISGDIGMEAFSNCTSLTVATIPSNAETINSTAFNGCTNLSVVQLPNTIKSIKGSCFINCTGIRGPIVFPATLTEIGNQAFSGCYNIYEYHFLGTVPPTFGTKCFNNYPTGAKIYVPRGYLSAYQTAGSTYASIMEEEPA